MSSSPVVYNVAATAPLDLGQPMLTQAIERGAACACGHPKRSHEVFSGEFMPADACGYGTPESPCVCRAYRADSARRVPTCL